mgnify:CR=1 FL=1
MKLLLENWRKFLNEADEKTIEEARELLRGNTHLANTADHLRDENLIDAGQYIFLHFPPGQLPPAPDGKENQGSFGHIKASHTMTSDLPGSKFNDNLMSDEALTQVVVSLLKDPPKPPEVEITPYGTKIKWLNAIMKDPIGMDSIIKKDHKFVSGRTPRPYEYKERIGNNRGIPSIMDQGVKVLDKEGNELSSPEESDPEGIYYTQQTLPVIDGPLQPTELLNLIVADLGKIAGRTLVSVVTMFPGASEPQARNKKDYAKLGYYFLSGQ